MADSDRAYPSVWARPRKERSALTREQIVTQALELLDSEGIEALSMRKLAARLDAGTTSLYWHVANREELIVLVLDTIYGELDLPDVDDPTPWREATRRLAHSMRATTLRHRWVVSVLDHVVAAIPGPNLTNLTERMLRVFEAAGFELREAERALNTVSAYVTGIAMSEAALYTWLERHGQTPQAWLEEGLKVAEEATEGNERFRELLADYRGKDPQEASNEDFEYGLERVLDGLEARLEERRR